MCGATGHTALEKAHKSEESKGTSVYVCSSMKFANAFANNSALKAEGKTQRECKKGSLSRNQHAIEMVKKVINDLEYSTNRLLAPHGNRAVAQLGH